MLKNKLYPLTNPQKNIWDTELFFRDSNLNNVCGCVFIEEKMNVSLLEKAIRLYVKNNDALRLRLQVIDGTPFQFLETDPSFSIDVISLNDKKEAEQLNEKLAEKPFSLFDSNLFSFTIFQFPNGYGGFNFTLHHLISDAWGMSLIIRDVIYFYTSFIKQETLEDMKKPSYLEVLSSEENYLASSRFEKDEAFWHSLFEEDLELSYISQKNTTVLDTKAIRKTFHLSSSMYDRISDFCKDRNTSIYTFFMAIYSLYLSKINHTTSSTIGSPILNRSGIKEKNTAGMFISTVPFKVDVNRNFTFSEFLKQVAITQLSIFKHQKYPFSRILQDVKKKHQMSENLYDFVLSYQNAKDDSQSSCLKHFTKWYESGHILDSLEVHFFDMNDTR